MNNTPSWIQDILLQLDGLGLSLPASKDWRQGAERLGRLARDRLRLGLSGKQATALSTFVRPDLSHISPSPLLRALEPVVALVGLALLALLGSMAGAGMLTFVLTSALILLLLTRVFGLQLDLNG